MTDNNNNFVSSMQSQQSAKIKPSASLTNLITVLNLQTIADIPKLFESQGNAFSFNHTLDVPVVQELLSDLKETFKVSNPFSFTGIFKNFALYDLDGNIDCGMYGIGLWAFILVCLLICRANLTNSEKDVKRRSTINNYIFVVLSCMIMFLTVSSVVTEDMERSRSFLSYLHEEFDELNSEIEMLSVNENFLVPQSFAEDPRFALSISALMCLCVGYRVQDKFVSSLIAFSRVNKNQNETITSMLTSGSNCISLLCGQIGLENMKEYFHIEVITDGRVKKFDESSRYFLNSLSSGDLFESAFFSAIYHELLSEGELILKLIKDAYETRLVTELLKKLRLSADRVDQLNRSLGGVRIEPVGVIFKGPPGCMKTVLNDRVSFLVGKYTIPEPWKTDYEEDPKTFQFALPKDKFFDTYTYKKWVVNVDDVFQQRDTSSSTDPETLKIISMINTAEYCLPMAKVEEKNSRYFRSPFVFATTNLDKWDMLESVISPEAVRRRFHVEVDVDVSEKYKVSGKFDPSLLPFISFSEVAGMTSEDFEKTNSTYIPDDFWKISVTKKKGNVVYPSEDILLEDLVIMIIDMHHERVRNYYVNMHVSQNVSSDSVSKLNDHFSHRELKDYAFLQKETLSKSNAHVGSLNYLVSQAGKSSFCEFDFVSCFEELSATIQISHLASFKSLLHDYRVPFVIRKLVDLAPKFLEFLSSLNPELLLSHVDDFKNSVIGFSNFIASVFRERTRNFLHPIDGTRVVRSKTIHYYYSKFESFFKPVLAFLKQYWHYVALLSLVGAIILPNVVSSIKALFGHEEIISQSLDLSKDRSRVGKFVSLKDQLANITLKPQAPTINLMSGHVLPTIDVSLFGEKNNLSDVSVKILKKYFFIVYMVKPDDSGNLRNVRLGHAWNIRGQVFAMPLHFLYVLHDTHKDPSYKGASLIFTTSTKSTRYICKIEDVLSTFKISDDSARNDVCLFTIPGSHANSTGVFKFLAKQKDLVRLSSTSSFASTVIGTYLSTNSDSNTLRLVKGPAQMRTEAPVKATWADANHMYLLEGVLQYAGDFNAGDCGSMLLIDSNDFENRCVFGMHVAGEKGSYGVSSILLQEYIELLLNDSFSSNFLFVDEEECSMTNDTVLEAQGPMFPVSILKNEFMTSNADTTQMRRSVFWGKLPEPFRDVKLFPAKLRDFVDKETGQVISPGLKAVAKYEQIAVPFDRKILDDSVASYESLIMQYCIVPSEARIVIPLSEALHSFRKVRGISSSTSPGFPLCLDKNENVKRLYYQAIIDEDKDLSDSYRARIANLVCERESMMIDGIRPSVFYKDCLKDEKIPLEKVLVGKTRLFSACDFILLVMFRQYFGAFMSSYFEANLNVGSAIGINPYSGQWDDMSRRLLKFSSKNTDLSIGAGDYSGFDTREFPQVLDAILQIINRWYGNSDKTGNLIRRALWSDIVNSKHVWNNAIYDWTTGMPSGNPLTSIINTMYNNILFRMAYGEVGLPISMFNKTVVLFALGDDNVFSVHEVLREQFNEITLAEIMPILGMVYTTELKGKATIPFRSLSDVEFLKRSFRKDKSLNRWVAPLRMEAIFGTLNWTKSGIQGHQITADELSSVFSELSLHGRGTFEHYSRKLFDLKGEYLASYQPSKELSLNFTRVYEETLNLDFLFSV